LVHPVEFVKLLDRTLIEDHLGFGPLEELVDRLGQQPNREVVMAVVSKDRLEIRQRLGIRQEIPCLVDCPLVTFDAELLILPDVTIRIAEAPNRPVLQAMRTLLEMIFTELRPAVSGTRRRTTARFSRPT
jgi:hypothetical protein